MHHLVTLAYSHYNERARWALDRARLPYTEERHMPLFSHLAVLRASRGRGGRGDRVSSRLSTPYLITTDGQHLADSGDILRWATARGEEDLFPDDEVVALDQRIHDRVGPHLRRIAYWYVLGNPQMMQILAERNVGARQARWFHRAAPLVERMITRGLAVDEAGKDRSLAAVEPELEAIEARLADGRPYLCGERFTAADLTFAALASIMVMVQPEEGYSAALPTTADLDAEAAAFVAQNRDRPAGRFVLRMYATERDSSARIG